MRARTPGAQRDRIENVASSCGATGLGTSVAEASSVLRGSRR
jgi:hypothetical protein